MPHRNPQTAVRFLKQFVGDPLRFTTKDQNRPRLEADIIVISCRFFRKVPMRFDGQLGDQCGPIVDDLPFKVLPIIEARPAEIGILGAKSERPHEPQFRPNGHAGPPDVAGVVMNLRLMEHDVQLGFVGHGKFENVGWTGRTSRYVWITIQNPPP